MRLKQKKNVQEAGRELVSVIHLAKLGDLILPTFPTSSTMLLSQGSAALTP
jgi:hypothetical protein